MRKSYITKKNIGKIKSKTSRLGKSKKNSRKKKQNKIHKILKQSGGANKRLILDQEYIRNREGQYNDNNLRKFSSIIPKLKTTGAEPPQVPKTDLFKSPDANIFGTIDAITIGLILKLIKQILIELKMKIEILEYGEVMPQRTSANRRTSSIEFDNFINGIEEDKKSIGNSTISFPKFQEPTISSPTLSSLPEAIKFLKDKRIYYDNFFNHIIIEFAVKNRQAIK